MRHLFRGLLVAAAVVLPQAVFAHTSDSRPASVSARAAELARAAAAHADGGRIDLALSAAGEAERLAREARDYVTLSAVERARAVAARFRGQGLAGLAHARLAAEHAERSGDRAALSAAYSQVASSYQTMSDWSRTLDYAQRAYDTHPEPTDRVRGLYLIQRGIVLHELREGAEAIASFEEAGRIARRIGDARLTAYAALEIGMTLWLIEGRPSDALPHYEDALAWARKSGSVTLLPPLYTNWGGTLRDLKRYDEAMAKFRAGLAIRPDGGPNVSAATLTKNLGQTLALAGRTREARPVLEEAMALADRMNAGHARWQSRMELAMLLAPRDAAAADRYFEESISLLEASSNNVLLEQFRAGVFGHWLNKYDPFDLYMEFLIARGETDRAFDIAERARARAFLDTLSNARDEIARVVPAALAAAESALLREISTIQTSLRARTLAAADRRALEQRIAPLEARLAAARVRIAAAHPALAHARYPAAVRAPDLARALAANEYAAMFYLGLKQSTCWIVSAGGIRVVRLPRRQELAPIVRAYVEALKSPAGAVRAPGMALSAALRPVLDALPEGARLVVIPHDALNYLPFEALMSRDGEYLAARHPISYAASASTFLFLRRTPPAAPSRPSLLAIGAPPSAASGVAAARDAGLRQVAYLKPLVYARHELREIASIFGRDARVLYGRDATEANIAAAGIERASVVHFATHGLMDQAKPERSALALAPRPPADDGILQVREIYRWRLSAALVTLSACETALGREVAGEGFLGLSRAFFGAGATAVTASLWNVDDRSTARFMRTFYAGLHRGDPIDIAARNARLAMIRAEGRFSHPYYWSPFVVAGNASRRIELPAPAATAGIEILTPSIAAACGVLAIAFRRRRP